LVATLLSLGSLVPAAVSRSSAAERPPLDVRERQIARGATKLVPAARLAARRALARRLGPRAAVQSDPVSGGVRYAGDLDGFLTSRRRGDPERIVLDYVRAHEGVFGLDADDVKGLRLVRRYASLDGITHLTWAQFAAGIPSFDTDLRANVTADGRIVNILGSPRPDLEAPASRPVLSAGQALARAARDARAALFAPRGRTAPDARRTTRFTGGHTARLVLFVGPDRTRLAWRVMIDAGKQVYDSVLDARTGDMLVRAPMVAHASGLAWDAYPGAPGASGTAVTRDFTPWLTSPSILRGNNTHVYADVNGDDVDQAAEEIPPVVSGGDWDYGRVPVASPNGNCPAVGCSWNHDVPNSWRGSGDAILRQNATQVFYFVNRFHDHLAAAPIGFGEAAGNFQAVNATAAGADGDAIRAETSDGADTAAGLPDAGHVNNANMFVPPDGQAPRMQMYLFKGRAGSPVPDVNSGDDASVVYHEYTHGLTNRLVTDTDGFGALRRSQSRAMDEGWADWFAMDFLVREGHGAPDTAAPGEIFLFDHARTPVSGGGRASALDCPPSTANGACPGTAGAGPGGFTFGDYGRVHPKGPESHADGEIFAQTLWDLRTRLIADLGTAAGVARVEMLVTRGLELTPVSPSFLDARNAILQADTVAGGADRARIWEVFAARGMGFFASTVDAADREPVEDFSLPPSPAAMGTVAGQITDADTDAPLAGARVSFGGHNTGFGGDLAAVTGGTGAYSMPGVPTGTYPHMIVSRAGYERSIDRASFVVSGATTTRNRRMRRDWARIDGGATVLVQGAFQAGCEAARVADGLTGNSWTAARTPSPDLIIKLPQAVDISAVVIDPTDHCEGESSSLGEYTISTASQVGTGPGAFTEMAQGTFVKADNHRGNSVRPATATTDVRYVSVTPIKPQGALAPSDFSDEEWKSYVSIAAVEVYASVNKPPKAAFSITPAQPLVGDSVSFNPSGSADPDGTIERYEWDLDGNGTFETSSGYSVSKTYSRPQEITVRLRVTDDRGETDITTRPLLVASSAEISELGTLGGATGRGGRINASGVVAGDADVAAAPAVHAFRFEGGAMSDLATLPGQRDSLALDVNGAGQAVGASGPEAEQFAGRAVLWTPDAAPLDLGTLGGADSRAFAINDAGAIAGGAENADGIERAFYRPAGGPLQEIGTFDSPPMSGSRSRAYDVNASGQVVGYSEGSGRNFEHAFRWSPGGQPIDLGTLGGSYSVARAINDAGQITGYGDPFLQPSQFRGFVRESGGLMRFTGTLGGASSQPRDINNLGQVVGAAQTSSGAYHAFLWEDGKLTDLNAYLPEDDKADWVLEIANGINDGGQISGHGYYKGVGRPFVLDIGACEFCVEAVSFEHQRYPEKSWTSVPATGTTDGNRVRISARVRNKDVASKLMTVKFIDRRTGQELPDSRISPLLLQAGETKTVSAEWDTTDRAWTAAGEPASSQFIRVKLELGRSVLDSRGGSLKVVPRPVFMVHGLLSSAATWDAYIGPAGFIEQANPDWRAFAVTGLNTGSYATAASEPNTIYENAKVLHDYIESKRDDLDAWRIDLLGHSMGGLISRQYIQTFMPDGGTEQPVARHLAMLGTPNQGSACADLLPLAITYELRPEVVAEFNGRVANRRGVPFSLLAGNPKSHTCQDLTEGDGVVSLPSALWTLTDTETTNIGHTDMTGSATAFSALVKPRLTALGPPARAADSRASEPPRAAAPQQQLLAARSVALEAGQTLDIPLGVQGATRIGSAVAAPSGVASSLRNPAGDVIDAVSAGSSKARELVRTSDVASPVSGTWTLRLENTGGPAQAQASAWVKGAAVELTAEPAPQAGDGTLPLKATLTDGGARVPGATVTATISRIHGPQIALTLLDDGAHEDGAANDGVYGARSEPLTAGATESDAQGPSGHLVVVRAQAPSFTRAVVTSTLATATAPAESVTTTARAGDLDRSFGKGGKAITPLLADEQAEAVAVQSDGKVVSAGITEDRTLGHVLAVVRHRENGTLDPGFGTSGKVLITPVDLHLSGDVGLAIQPDGKILVATGWGGQMTVARYLASGEPDTTFATAGVLRSDLLYGVRDLVVDPDGRILLAGYNLIKEAQATQFLTAMSVARLTASGAPDTTFGTGGVVTHMPSEIPFGEIGRQSDAAALALQSDGRIVIAGSADIWRTNTLINPHDVQIAVGRLLANGALDPDFGGGDGFAITAISPYDPDRSSTGGEAAQDVIVTAAGRIVAAGTTTSPAPSGNPHRRMVLVRHLADGTPDDSFGPQGVRLTAFPTFDEGEPDRSQAVGRAVAEQSDGRLVLAGSRYARDPGDDFALARLLGDGVLDSAFGSDGLSAPVIGRGFDSGRALALAPDGKLVLAGSTSNGRDDDFAVIRIHDEDIVEINPQKPPACADVTTSTERDRAVGVGLSCSDSNGDAFDLSIADAPGHGTLSAIDQQTGVVTYTPAAGYVGADTFTYRATDAAGPSPASRVSITVTAPPPEPPKATPTPGPGPGPGPGSGSSGSGGGSGGGGGGSTPTGGPLQIPSGGCPIDPRTRQCVVPVQCPPATPGGCNGDISGRIGGAKTSALAGASARFTVVLKGRFKLKPGERKKVRLKLTPAGRKLLAKRKTLRVVLIATYRDAAGRQWTSRRTLKVTRAKRAKRSSIDLR